MSTPEDHRHGQKDHQLQRTREFLKRYNEDPVLRQKIFDTVLESIGNQTGKIRKQVLDDLGTLFG